MRGSGDDARSCPGSWDVCPEERNEAKVRRSVPVEDARAHRRADEPLVPADDDGQLHPPLAAPLDGRVAAREERVPRGRVAGALKAGLTEDIDADAVLVLLERQHRPERPAPLRADPPEPVASPACRLPAGVVDPVVRPQLEARIGNEERPVVLRVPLAGHHRHPVEPGRPLPKFVFEPAPVGTHALS